MLKENRARIMNILSMAIFGTIGLMVRNISVSSGELALYRAAMATVLIGIFLLVTKQKISLSKIRKELPQVVLGLFFLTVSLAETEGVLCVIFGVSLLLIAIGYLIIGLIGVKRY